MYKALGLNKVYILIIYFILQRITSTKRNATYS